MARGAIGRDGWAGTRALARAGLLLAAAVALGAGAAAPAAAQDSTAEPMVPKKDAKLQLTAESIKRAGGPDVIVRGKGFTPGGLVRVTLSPPPQASAGRELGTVRANARGEFVVRTQEACTATNAGSVHRVSVTATDLTAGTFTSRAMSGGPWVC